MSVVERKLKGIAVSSGIAFGHAVTAWDPKLVTLNYSLKPEEVPQQIKSFLGSIEKSRIQLEKVQSRLARSRSGDSTTLIDAHLMILEDKMFIGRIVAKIEDQQINAEWAIQSTSETILAAYDRIHDDYLRERRGDLEDVVRRLLVNLRSYQPPTFRSLRYHTILVGKTVLPSTLVELKSPRLVGLVTETGSPLSHTAILARSLEVPSVVGVSEVLPGLTSGELIIVDGDEGIVIRAPSDETIDHYRRRESEVKKSKRRLARMSQAPCVTKDRISVLLGANINFKDEVRAVVAHDCEAIGLYRTEFEFFRDGREPEEDRLVKDYSEVMMRAKELPINFRTVDSGLKNDSGAGMRPETDLRGLRFCLAHREIFRKQLRAIYRASPQGHARIVLPFVSTLDELSTGMEIIADVKKRLTRLGIPYDETVPVGVMIETPAAAQTCDMMASQVDFFCLGTNDLLQHCLAIDRTDRSALHLYSPFHPAVLRLLKQVRELLLPTGKPVVVCGELAADPISAALLLGLGFTELSVNMSAYSNIKKLIRSVSIADLREMIAELMQMESHEKIERRVRSILTEWR